MYAWGKRGHNSKFEKIIAVCFRKETKYQQVYVFEETEYGRTRLQRLADKIHRQESVEKPILEKREGVGQAKTPDEAIESAFGHIDSVLVKVRIPTHRIEPVPDIFN